MPLTHCMVENCLLNNNKHFMFHLVECEIQHKKRRHASGDIYLTGMLDVFLRLRKLLSLCVCPFFPRFANRQPRQHCKFTYNNAHTLIQPLNSSQLFAYLISHLLFSVFYFYSHFMHEIRLVFLFAQWWFFLPSSRLFCVLSGYKEQFPI